MIPDLDSISETVRREAAFALTLGAGLFGAALGALWGASLMMFVAIGMTAWSVSSSRHPAKGLALKCGAGVVGSIIVWVLFASPHGARSLLLLVPYAAPATGALVLVLLSLTAQLSTYASAESHEDGVLARLAASRWLLLVALASCVLAALLRSLSLGAGAISIALIAAVRWALARDALTTGRQWLQHVRDGDAIGWRVVDAELVEAHESLELSPVVRGAPMEGLLIRGEAGSPYRGDVGGVPVARAPRAKWRESRGRWKLPDPAAMYSLVALWAFGVPFLVLSTVIALVGESGALAWMIAFVVSLPCVVWASFLTKARRRRIWSIGILGFVASVFWHAYFEATASSVI